MSLKAVLAAVALLLLTPSLSASEAVTHCPPADLGYAGGCVVAKENPADPQSRDIRLFYQFLGEFDPAKETLIAIMGGPGGSLHAWVKEPSLLQFQGRFNVLLYDQRGVGRSSVVTEKNLAQVDLSQYHTRANVEDIELIRREVLGQEKLIVFGHSYGAHLAFAYATAYPDHVLQLWAFNGGVDGLAMNLQHYAKQIIIGQIVQSVDEKAVEAVVALAPLGQITDPDTEAVISAFADLAMKVTLLISSRKGQEDAKAFFSRLIERNQAAIDEYLSQTKRNEQIKEAPRFDYAIDEQFNMFINKQVVCQDLIRPDVINSLSVTHADFPEADVKSMARFAESTICQGVIRQEAMAPYDVKPLLKRLRYPVLIVGGKFDPLTPLYAQERDYELIRQAGLDSVTLVVGEEMGHQIFDEDPVCAARAMKRMADGEMPAGRLSCGDL